MSAYDERPWLARYAPGQPADIDVEYDTALEMFAATVARHPDGDAIRYFDGRISFARLDALSDAFAAGLAAHGVAKGDRVALYLQNVPQFVIAQIGTWKAGGVAVAVNPMNRERELEVLLADSGARVLVCLESLYRDVASAVVPRTGVETVVTTSELEYQTRADERLFAGIARVAPDDTLDMAELLEQHGGETPPATTLGAEDIAFLTYTSGTTGPPKGAMTTHRNVVFNARTYRDWIGLGHDDVVLGVAPLFHITGLIGHVAISLLVGAPLVLMYRLDPGLTLETVAAEKATFTVGSITVFIALMNAPTPTPPPWPASPRSIPAARRSRRARSRPSRPPSATTSTTSTASPRPRRPPTPSRGVPGRRSTRRRARCRSGSRSTTPWCASSGTTGRTCRPARWASW